MTDNMYESLSALMDSEVEEEELEKILSNIGTNEELRAQWSKLNRIRDLLHGITIRNDYVDVSSTVRERLNQESGRSILKNRGLYRDLLNPLASFAVAASVTAIVVLGGQGLLHEESSRETNYAGGVSPISMTPIAGSTPRPASFTAKRSGELLRISNYGDQKTAFDQLRIYGIEHAAQASAYTSLGELSYIRVPIEQK